MKESRRWYRLDNAAKIYPASRNRRWQAIFRMSCELNKPVNPALLADALDATLPRFSTIAVRLRSGMFWYYLEHNEGAPDVEPDVCNPCGTINLKDNRGFCFRVRYYDNRIAVEFFHALTDGTGGLIFLKTLVAQYLRLSEGAQIPCTDGVLDCDEPPHAEELEDSFLKYATDISKGRNELNAYQIGGQRFTDGFSGITTGIMSARELKTKAREKGVTITEYLTAAIIFSLQRLQFEDGGKKKLPLKVSVPVSLRNFFKSATLRNFSSYINVGIESRFGEYTFDEILNVVRHQLALELNKKQLSARFSANVRDERNVALRLAPLFLKNLALKIAFLSVGDRKVTTTLSNIGVVAVPEAMREYVKRFDFLLGPPSRNAEACSLATYGDMCVLNIVRTLVDARLERELFRFLVKNGIKVKVESNQRY